MKKFCLLLVAAFIALPVVYSQQNIESEMPRVTLKNGVLEGLNVSGLKVFKGIPFAEPPVGDLRWHEPMPVKDWTGVRKADHFGPRAMQLPLFGDMNFRSDGVSEDCLYLNVWTAAKSGSEKLPVLVYFYGGGLMAGDGSEPRYDGESLARRGIVTVTVNYRLTVFGFLAHPELTKESTHHASGNYGLLDQAAALQWVHDNIGVFGGDPSRVTIAGESAGSFSVSAQMASPLSKNLIAGAIGESGSLLGNKMATLADAEKRGVEFQQLAKAKSLAELRAMPAQAILDLTKNTGYGRFPVAVDGYFFEQNPIEVFEQGKQAQVPLLVGWNSAEGNFNSILNGKEPTVANYKEAVKRMFKDNAEEVLKVYAANDDAAVKDVATALAGDMFIGFSTWNWSDLHAGNSSKPVYRYFYTRPRPDMRPEMGNAVAGLAGGVIRDTAAVKAPRPPRPTGAVHSAEIEYALGNLPTNRVYDWEPEDYRVSEIMQSSFANFIKTGDPNGLGVPTWQPVEANKAANVMIIDNETKAITETHRDRYLYMRSQIK